MDEALICLIQKAIDIKHGDKQFALFYFSPGDWRADIGGSQCVMLGEVAGRYFLRFTTWTH